MVAAQLTRKPIRRMSAEFGVMATLSKRSVPGLLVALLFLGCGGDSTEPEPAKLGSIRVTVIKPGLDFDEDGYTVRVEDEAQHVPSGTPALFEAIAPGSYQVEIGGLLDNCDVSGGLIRTIEVAGSSEATVEFLVECDYEMREIAYPPPGGIHTMKPDGTDFQYVADGFAARWLPDDRIGFHRFATNTCATTTTDLFVVQADGSDEQPVQACILDFAFSPDGQQVAFLDLSGLRDQVLWVVGIDGSGLYRLSADSVDSGNRLPEWSPDGASIAYQGAYPGGVPSTWQIFVVNADGTEHRRLTDPPATNRAPVWSPDGSRLLFLRRETEDGPLDIWAMNADGSDQIPLTGGDSMDEWYYEWSPDGTKILYISRECEGCDTEVFSMNPDGTDRRNLTNHPADENHARWSRDGERIYFRSTRDEDPPALFHTMNPDGTGQAYLPIPE